ncbi:hypothetical protein [Streptomyces sp. VNUA24]|uniref:hypothetical protein n=1 Tax=Streptomyces sp. VNUA24 TaxID=3031131 RepID=UPI0023B7F762|nr:hypothetical protein [Streptomyces sp. VNUA24]WEH19031.1 hypothetical protein PYR72_37280 [Streptomyces sp. VNUA24]
MELSARALSELPGVRRQISRIAADLAAGIHCLWLLPDDLVEGGYAEELHHVALCAAPDRLDIPARSESETLSVPPLEVFPEQTGWALDDLPLLEDYDDGFDLGREPVLPRQRSAPRLTDAPEAPESGLLARLAEELSVPPREAVDTLVDPDRRWRPVIGVRAWEESAASAASGDPEQERGREVARLIRSLNAAAKQAGLPPENRPRLLVTARVDDLPPRFPDELELDLATSAVHWWWGTVDRLDSATVVSAVAADASRDTRRRGEMPRDRILRAVRDEVVSEVCGPDPVLGWRLAGRWDGSQGTLEDSLRACLDGVRAVPPEEPLTVLSGVGSGHRPATGLRPAWARGLLQAWDGRSRVHPVVWCGDRSRSDHLKILVSQAQARVLLPWIEEARRRVASRALSAATRPLAELIDRYVERPPAGYRARAQEVFRTIEVGPLLRACRQGHLNLPVEDRRLLEQLVLARNVLSHRGVLFDRTLHILCDELAGADQRWTGDM